VLNATGTNADHTINTWLVLNCITCSEITLMHPIIDLHTMHADGIDARA